MERKVDEGGAQSPDALNTHRECLKYCEEN